LPEHWHTNEAFTKRGHKVYGFRGDKFGRHRKVTLIFTIFIINYDDHPTSFYIL
jgi:hypothetical protein